MELEGLVISTLGGLSLIKKGEPVKDLVSNKAKALLVYLACENRTISREILAELLWEERGQRRALSNLRVVLTSLRKELGGFITITRDSVSINGDANIQLDVTQFEDLLSAADFERAVKIYRGDFLEGFYLRGARDFEDWIVVNREEMKSKYWECLDTLVEKNLEIGDYTSSIHYINQLLSNDLTRETAHRKKMRLLVYNGQREAALKQYQDCWKILGDELGLEPSQETRQLYQEILDEKIVIPGPVVKQKSALRIEPPKFLEKDARDRKPALLFVAKERQLKKLNKYLQKALNGQGVVAFVSGGPGRGKTALVDEFGRRSMLEHPDLLVVKGSCNAYTGIGDPYLPFREALSMLSGDVEAQWKAGAITTEHACRIWKIIPLLVKALLKRGPNLIETFLPGSDLLERSQAAAPERNDLLEALTREVGRPKTAFEGLDQSHLFEQFTNVLCLVANEHPLLLILDDLQWADTASTGLLFHLGRRISAARIMIAGAYRPEEVALGREGMRHPLEKILAEFTLSFGDIKLDLAEGEETEGIQFVTALLDSEPNRLDDSFRQALFAHTGGHPLFTIELLRSLQDRGELRQDEDGCWNAGPAIDWECMPARVEAVIAERITRLEDEPREILTVASVEGEDFTAQVVARIQKMEERRLLSLLSGELEKRHRLIHARSGLALDHKMLARYRFAHHLFQQYLYSGLSEGERQLLHGEIARALEGLFAEQSEKMRGSIAYQLGWHYTQSGEVEKAVEYLILGGDQAFDTGAYREALRNYEQARNIIPIQDTAHRPYLFFKMGETLARLADYTNAYPYLEEARELALAFDDREIEIKALYRTAFFKRVQGFDEKASEIVQRALEISKSIGDQDGKMFSMKMMGILVSNRGDLDRGDTLFKCSQKLARELGDWYAAAACLNNLGVNAMYRGDLSQAMRFLEEGIEIAKQNNLRHVLPILFGNYGRSVWPCGDYQGSRIYLEEGLSIAEQTGDLWVKTELLTDLGDLSRVWGHYNAAKTFLEQAIHEAQECGEKSFEAYPLHFYGHFLIATGDYANAQFAFEKAHSFYKNINRIFEIGECLYGLGLTAIWSGQYEQALGKFNSALEITNEAHKILNTRVVRGIGEVHHKQGENKIARKYYQKSLSMAAENEYRIEMVYCHASLGQIYVESGDFKIARNQFSQALKISTEIELIPATVETLVGVASMLNQLNQARGAAMVSAWAVGQEQCTHASREEVGRLLEELKLRMEAQKFEKAVALGRNMDLEQILEEVKL